MTLIKSQQDFANPLIDEVIAKNNLFFAFSKRQFAEKAIKGVEYVAILCGGYCPKENAEEALKGLAKASEEARLQYREYCNKITNGNGDYHIVKSELWNVEAFYDYENIYTAIETLKPYGFSDEFIFSVHREEREKQ